MEMFHLRTDVSLLFQTWRIQSSTALIGACLVAFLFAAFHEGLKILRQWLMSKYLLNLIWSLRQTSHSEAGENHIQDNEGPLCRKGTTLKPKEIQLTEKRTWRQDIYLWQTLLYTLQVAVGYMLMLTVMTYNTWLGVAVLAGVGTGYLAFSVVFPDHLIFRTTHREGLLLEDLSHRDIYRA